MTQARRMHLNQDLARPRRVELDFADLQGPAFRIRRGQTDRFEHGGTDFHGIAPRAACTGRIGEVYSRCIGRD